MSDKRYCLQCGAELLVNAVARDPAYPHSDLVPACANCGARNYDTAVESQGINMILAGRVKTLELELEERKRIDAMNSDTAIRAYRLGADSQNMLCNVIVQRGKLYRALSFLVEALDGSEEKWQEHAKKKAKEILQEMKGKI